MYQKEQLLVCGGVSSGRTKISSDVSHIKYHGFERSEENVCRIFFKKKAFSEIFFYVDMNFFLCFLIIFIIKVLCVGDKKEKKREKYQRRGKKLLIVG